MASNEVTRHFALAQPKLRAYIRSVVFNPSDVDDILQNVAVAAIENADRYDPSRSLDAWMMGIAKKHVLKYFDKTSRQKLRFSSEFIDALSVASIDSAADFMKHENSLDILQGCLGKLDNEKRDLVVRRHKAGVTARKLAREIGYTDTRMSRMLNSLYSVLMRCVQQQLA